MIYLYLFTTALISATIFPLGSEGLLLYYLNEGYDIPLLLLFASSGNTAGSCINFYLGYKGEEFLERKKIIEKNTISKYSQYFSKYGGFILLLSPLPVIGDPITVVAGVLKYNFKKFFWIVLFAKFTRYFILSIPFL